MKLNNNDDSHNSGLNLLIYNMLLDIESHPAWVCGLKQYRKQCFPTLPQSHPAWVCGLKPNPDNKPCIDHMSHPAWVCGLKPKKTCWAISQIVVTPCVGVWIETDKRKHFKRLGGSHPAWVCGLKPGISTLIGASNPNVTPCVGVWIETRERRRRHRVGMVTPCVGVWIETFATNTPGN